MLYQINQCISVGTVKMIAVCFTMMIEMMMWREEVAAHSTSALLLMLYIPTPTPSTRSQQALYPLAHHSIAIRHEYLPIFVSSPLFLLGYDVSTVGYQIPPPVGCCSASNVVVLFRQCLPTATSTTTTTAAAAAHPNPTVFVSY